MYFGIRLRHFRIEGLFIIPKMPYWGVGGSNTVFTALNYVLYLSRSPESSPDSGLFHPENVWTSGQTHGSAPTGRWGELTHDINTMVGYAYERVRSGQPMAGARIPLSPPESLSKSIPKT
jgi:hypothetical protein